MSNLNQNTVDLQAILDAVNALPESTDLTPIVDALAEKGQTVPDGATVDVLASLIAAIEAGGAKIEKSILVPASDIKKSSPLTINHTLGVLPDFVCIVAFKSALATTRGVTFSCVLLSPPFSQVTGGSSPKQNYYYYASLNSVGSGNPRGSCASGDSDAKTISELVAGKAMPILDMTDETITLCGVGDAYGGTLLAGYSYWLIVGGIGYE